ncbi:MAG: hypothetical protein J0G95_07310 [Rhizobiales bacterium]|nr:hypothetical protein [Hyphomicrobiales bacterium]
MLFGQSAPIAAAAAADAGVASAGIDADIDDGSAHAPACTIQHPSVLTRYRVRPDWRVAGVDYCVGYAAGTVLKDPATISMPGVSVDARNQVVAVTGNDVTLDGYDFSTGGGWSVFVQAANTRILNSKFVIGARDNPPIYSNPANGAPSNLYVGYSVIDGNERSPGYGGLITMVGRGLTVEYCWLKNAGGDMIQQHHTGGNVVVRYNLIEQGGLAPGAHGDYTQFLGSPITTTIIYNTTIQNGGATQGFMTEYVTSGEIGHNTMMGSVSYFVSVDISSIVTTFTVHDNYFDPGGYGFAYPSPRNGMPNDASPKTIFTNNVDMRTGGILQDSHGPAAKSSGSRP